MKKCIDLVISKNLYDAFTELVLKIKIEEPEFCKLKKNCML